jgi:hypothetical protein
MSTPEPFWYDDPNVLFSRNTWYVFVPQASMSVKAALNAVVRFSTYLALLLTATSRDVWYLLLVPLVMVVTIFLEKWFPQAKKISEGFRSGPVVSGYSGTETSMPSDDNPFMNPQLTDIRPDNDRPPAADVTDIKVRDKVNKSFAQTSNIYMDTSDVFDLVQSQRNFYTVPEDDHAGFLSFLGKNAQYSNQKLLSEGFVVAKGTFRELPTPAVSTAPTGTAPA